MQTSTIVPQFTPAECKYSISSPILPVNVASHLTFRGGMQTADARNPCSAGPCEVGYGAMRAAMHGESLDDARVYPTMTRSTSMTISTMNTRWTIR